MTNSILENSPITTIALNPAVDQTICLSCFSPSAVNRANAFRIDAGGKGVNVAANLAAIGCPVTITGFLGSHNADIFEEFLARRGITDRFIRLPGYTRVGIKITDEANQQTTDINLPGLQPSPDAMDEILSVIQEQAVRSRWIVLTGSLPPGVPSEFYARIIHLVKSSGCSIALDASQPALLPAVHAGPAVVKPNLAEIEELTGRSLPTIASVAAASRQLLDYSIDLIAVSLGSQGAVFSTLKQTVHARAPKVAVQTTVGAGDAMVSGLLASQILGLDLPSCAKLATAFSSTAIVSLERQPPDLTIIRHAAESIEVEELPVTSPGST